MHGYFRYLCYNSRIHVSTWFPNDALCFTWKLEHNESIRYHVKRFHSLTATIQKAASSHFVHFVSWRHVLNCNELNVLFQVAPLYTAQHLNYELWSMQNETSSSLRSQMRTNIVHAVHIKCSVNLLYPKLISTGDCVH